MLKPITVQLPEEIIVAIQKQKEATGLPIKRIFLAAITAYLKKAVHA